jgi:eukaryotic-like serine/threonine-protein kinase
MSNVPSLSPGARVGPYEVVAPLGEGGMGQVYRARDQRLSRDVALKVVHADLAQDSDRLRRFEQEAKAAGALNHPNIVAVYDTGECAGAPYIVSELLQGETLRDRMAIGSLGTRKAVDYAVQVARGLTAAHEKGIVHRDLKPENLFLTKDGLVKILDFGIAKLGRPGEEKADTGVETLSHTGTSPGTLLGTMGYMSPEQVRGLPADHRSDLFSFGAVLFEMLTGRRAFKGTTPADTLSAILREDPTEALGTGANLAPGLVRVVHRCLEKAPEDRFQTARDLAFALEGATTEGRPTTSAAIALPKAMRKPAGWLATTALLAVAAAAFWFGRNSTPSREPPSFRRLTFRVGRADSARFAPDGETIVYGAEWGTSPSELFSTRVTAAGTSSLGLSDAAILAISSREEMAILLRPRVVSFFATEGTLARVPLAGGAPREVLEGVLAADWSPDGKELAVIHVVADPAAVGDRYRLEYPIGRVLYEPDPPTWMDHVSVSPDGRRIAFSEHPVARDTGGSISVVGPNEPRRSLASGFAAAQLVHWSPGGDEVWFTGGRKGGETQQIHAVSMAGRLRVVLEQAGPLQLLDVSRRGQALLARGMTWTEIHARARGMAEEVDLPAAELSFLDDLSDDGKWVVGTDQGTGAGSNFSFYVQKTDGSPPVWLGEGDGQALSPDGRSVLTLLVQAHPQQLVVVPTGAGDARTLQPGPIVRYSRAVWDPSGRRVVIAGADASDQDRLYVQDVAGGPPTPVTGEGVTLASLGRPVSPDGRRVVALDADVIPGLYPLQGGQPMPVPGWAGGDVLSWTPDGRELIVGRYDETPPRIMYIDVASGRTRPWKGLRRLLPSSLLGDLRLLVTPDGESYAYGSYRRMSDLYLSSPLR